MHDVVREMALWIASDYGKQKNNYIVRAGAGLSEIPNVNNWNDVRRMSLISNKINRVSGSPKCFELRTLFLQENNLVTISGEFFRSMPKLLVLDLSWNRALSELPDGISELVSLKYLNLSGTTIRCLPVGLQELKNLIHLDLECTFSLSSIVGISALQSLKILKLLGSKVTIDSNTIEELKVLEHLEVLMIGISFYSEVLDQFLSSHKLMCCTQSLQIEDLQLESSDIWRLASMKKVCCLHSVKCTISEIKIDLASIGSGTVSSLQNLTNTCFLRVSVIRLLECKDLKELTWLMFAPNLRELYVNKAEELEDIINKEKARICEESEFVPFQKLESLQLRNLPKLKNIYWRPLPFPCLTRIIVRNCPKLRKLPLNSKSGSGGEKGLVIQYTKTEWIEGVEWEDETTKARFLPSSIK